jgi:hypothetical protein
MYSLISSACPCSALRQPSSERSRRERQSRTGSYPRCPFARPDSPEIRNHYQYRYTRSGIRRFRLLTTSTHRFALRDLRRRAGRTIRPRAGLLAALRLYRPHLGPASPPRSRYRADKVHGACDSGSDAIRAISEGAYDRVTTALPRR